MGAFVKWVLGIALSLAVTGNLKTATLKMAELAIAAQKDQLSYGKFSRALTEAPVRKRIQVH